MVHSLRHRRTLDIFRDRVECTREVNDTLLKHLRVWEIFTRSSYLGIADLRIWDRSEDTVVSEERPLTISGPKDRFEVPDTYYESPSVWHANNRKFANSKKLNVEILFATA